MKNKNIIFRVSESQHQIIKESAESYGISISEYLLNRSISPEKLHTPERKQELVEALYALNQTGNNLNQISKSLNTLVLHKQPNGLNVPEIKNALEDVSRAIKKLESQL